MKSMASPVSPQPKHLQCSVRGDTQRRIAIRVEGASPPRTFRASTPTLFRWTDSGSDYFRQVDSCKVYAHGSDSQIKRVKRVNRVMFLGGPS